MKLFCYFLLTGSFLIACSAYGPYGQNSQGVWNPSSTWQGPYDPNNPNNPNNPNGPNSPNNPNNPNGQNNPYDPSNRNNSYGSPNSNLFNGNTPPPNPFSGRTGSSRTNDLPFEFMLDTIASLTCENTVKFDSRRAYTFSAGSYRQPYGGLRLSKEFIKNNNIDRSTPYQKISQALSASPLIQARAQLSIRSEHDIRTVFSDENQPILDRFPPFNNPSSLHKLSRQEISFSTRSSSARSVYNSGKFQVFLPLSGSSFISLANDLQENTIGEALISLVYSLGNPNPIFSPDQRPYGRSYKLRFRDPYKADYLTGIYEENLSLDKREGQWECPIRFMGHRSNREDGGLFNKHRNSYAGSIPDNLSPEGFCDTRNYRLSNLERMFFQEEFGSSEANRLPFHIGTTIVWSNDQYYNTTQPCIVPKGAQTCYSNSGFYRIEFDPEKECSGRAYKVAGQYGQDPMEQDYYKICPGYLSVCFRTGD